MMDGEAPAAESTTPSASAPTTQEAPDTTENTSPDSGSQPDNRPAGFDPVDFATATPEQIQARFDRVYKNQKRYENHWREQQQANQMLAERLVEVQNSQHQIVQHIQGSDFQEAESRLSQERQDAWNSGDVNRYNAANDKLIEIKAQKIAQEAIQKNQPKPQQNQPQQRQMGVDGSDIVQRAIESGDILAEDANIYKSWANETDAYGNLKRPWVSQTDMRNPAAASEGKAVFNNPAFSNKPFAEKLREIDRRMGLTTQQGNNQSVLPGGNLTPARKANIVKLSPDIERVAVMTKYAAKPGMTPAQRAALTDADHIQAWKENMLKKSSGARK